MKRVATLADGFITMAVPRDDLRRRLDLIEEFAEEQGRDIPNLKCRSTAW